MNWRGVSVCVDPIHHHHHPQKISAVNINSIKLCRRTDEDVLPELTGQQVCLTHLRVGHPSCYEHEQPLTRFDRGTARTCCTVPARFCAPQRGRRCHCRPRAGYSRGGLWVVLDVRESCGV